MGAADVIVLVVYFVGVAFTGFWVGRGERTTHDFFLGGRQQHWLIVGLSIVATEVSALTFLIVPGRSFHENCWYLQLYAGAFVGRMLIVYILLPAFYGSNVTTVYEYLGIRFGPATRMTASFMFFASRLVGSGIRLLAASMALAMIFDWSLVWVVLGVTGLVTAYSAFGGIKSIIWTDALQAMVFLAGALATVIYLFVSIPGTYADNVDQAIDFGRLRVMHWGTDFNNDRLFWVLAIHAIVQNMAALGTDQDLTQRMLTCPDLKRGQRSLIFNAFVGFPVVCLFLLIGALLYVYAEGTASVLLQQPADEVFAYFIGHIIGAGSGLKGLLIAGVVAAAMSSLDSALGSLSSTAVTDYYRLYFKKNATADHYLRAARWFSVGFGMLLAAIAMAFAGAEDLLTEAFGWVSLMFGGMLGVFLLGTLTKSRGGDLLNCLAMVTSIIGLALLKYIQDRSGVIYIAWPWWVVMGCVWTLGIGACTRSGRTNPERETKLST